VLSNPYSDEKHDGAIFPMKGKMAFSSDSFVISPIFFPGGNIGELAVNGTVNDLAMCGAIPQFLSLSFIIEEGLSMTDFWEILTSIKNACNNAGVQVVTGDTKVVEKGKGDKIFINTSGVGMLHEKANISFRNIKVGDKIILSTQIATHGVAIMSIREGLDFETDIVSDTTNLNFTVKKILDEFGESVHLFRDPTRGGVATVLNEIARDCNLGIEIKQSALSVDEQVAGACEMLGLDPLYVANEGVFISIVEPSIADDLLNLLHDDENGKFATCIGEVVATHPRQVILASAIGGRRVVNMLVGEQLPRIC
jgi:hydrogenase expression/formation protein HypE